MSETSVLIATISSTAKVYVVGGIGYLCTVFPRSSPLLPKKLVGMTSRLTFNLFTIALIYSSIASTLSMGVMKEYWFVPTSCLFIIMISYIVATLTGLMPWFRLEHPLDFEALRIAASFPNIVALPILIFPTLCEFEVVHQAFTTLDPDTTSAEMAKECSLNATTMIFAYFLSWSCLFFSFGYQKLVNAGKRRQDDYIETASETDVEIVDENNGGVHLCLGHVKYFFVGVKQTLLSPGIIAMILAIITAAIPTLQSALFSQGGALRFLGSAIQSLGDAAPALGTLLVAASLNISSAKSETTSSNFPTSFRSDTIEGEENNMPMHNTSSRRRSSLIRLSQELSKSIRNVDLARIKPSLKMHTWFNLSRLILTPAVILVILLTLECTTAFMSNISPLSKLIVLIMSALPGAQIIVIVLKSMEATETSAIVARVYILHYLLNAVTITAWASLGLILFSPNEDGIALGDSFVCPWKK